MSGRKPPHTSASQADKIKCRVASCQAVIASQNYGRHLERFHPSEDSKDRRAYGQGKFNFGKLKVAENANDDEDVVEHEEEETSENTVTDINQNDNFEVDFA